MQHFFKQFVIMIVFFVLSFAYCDVVINEFMAKNDSAYADPQGEFDDWVEIYNTTGEPIDLGGMYITDDLGDLTKYQIPMGFSSQTTVPAEGFLVLWADEDLTDGAVHLDFKLSADGEDIALVNTDGITPIDSKTFGPQATDESMGRYPDGSSIWCVFSNPTPNALNVPVCQSPQFSQAGGVITGSFNLELTTGTPGATIYYTTDGSLPDETSSLYNSPINVTNTASTCIRARSYKTDYAPSQIVSNSYLAISADMQNYSSNFPIVIIDSFGYDIDAECNPNGGRPFRDVSAIFIDTNKTTGIANINDSYDFLGRGGMHVRGASTSCAPKKSYSFEVWDENNDDKEVSLIGFPDESDWILNGGGIEPIFCNNDERFVIRSILPYLWYNEIGQYAVRTKIVNVFLNQNGNMVSGESSNDSDYIGTYVFMEKVKRDNNRLDIAKLEPSDTTEPAITGGYLLENFQWTGSIPTIVAIKEPSDVTQIQTNWIQQYITDFNTDLLSVNFANPLATEWYGNYIDMESFVDYVCMVELVRNEAYINNQYAYKDRNLQLKIGPIWDCDFSLGLLPGTSGWLYAGANDPVNTWYQRLFEDTEFNLVFIDNWFMLRKSQLSTTKVLEDLNHYARLLQIQNEPKINDIRIYLQQRLSWIDSQLDAPPVFTCDQTNCTLEMTLPLGSSGTIYYSLDGSDPREEYTGNVLGTAYSSTLTLNSTTQVKARIKDGDEWSAINSISFIPSNIAQNIRITELMYNPLKPSQSSYNNDDFEFVELENIGDNSVNLNQVSFTYGIYFTFPNYDLMSGEKVVVVKNSLAFVEKYGSGYSIIGEYTGNLANDGENIILKDASGKTIIDFKYENSWYPETDGHGFSLVFRFPTVQDLEEYNYMYNWRKSSLLEGSPCEIECLCLGDSSGPSGSPDGLVTTSDMSDLLNIIFDYPGYSGPIPAGKECLDIASPSGYTPDGLLSSSDMSALLNHINPFPGYIAPCYTPPQ